MLRNSSLLRHFSKSKVESIQNHLTSSNFYDKFFPSSVESIANLSSTSSTLPSLIRKYLQKNQSTDSKNQAMTYDVDCLESVLLDPIKNIIARPSKLIRAMMVYNFKSLSGIADDDKVLHLCAFIEILHSLTLIIGKHLF